MPGVLLMPVSSPPPASASVDGKGAKAPLDKEVGGEVAFGSALASLVDQQQIADQGKAEMDELLLAVEGESAEKGGKPLPLDSPGLDVEGADTEAEENMLSLMSSSDTADEMLEDNGAVKSDDSTSDTALLEGGGLPDQVVNPFGIKSEAVIEAVGSNVKSTAHQTSDGLQQVPGASQAANALAVNVDATKKETLTSVQPAFVASLNPMVQKNAEQSKSTFDNQNKPGINSEGEFEGDKPFQLTKGFKDIESVELKPPQDGISAEKKLEMGMASLKQLKLSPQDYQSNSSSEKVADDFGVKPSISRIPEQVSTPKTDEPTKTTPAVTVQTPMGKPGFTAELGQRMVMMIGQKFQSAEIHVHPAELGPVDVRINFNKDHADVVFTSQNAVTRETLEQTAPRLREMLEENGISLGDLDVQDQAAGRREGRDAFGELADADGEADDAESNSQDEQPRQQGVHISRDRLVDFYV